MEKLMSKKVLMGAGLVLVAYLAYRAYAKNQAEKVKKAKELEMQQSAKPVRN